MTTVAFATCGKARPGALADDPRPKGGCLIRLATPRAHCDAASQERLTYAVAMGDTFAKLAAEPQRAATREALET